MSGPRTPNEAAVPAPPTSRDEAEALFQELLADFDGRQNGASLPWERVHAIQIRMAAYREARDREIREHAKRWDDGAEVQATVQIRAEHAVDVLPVLEYARKKARKLVANRATGAHEEQWCSSAVRITLDWNPEIEPAEPAAPAAKEPA